MKGVEYIMLEDKAYQIKACCGSDDLGQKEKGGSRLISVPSDPVSQIRVDGGQVQPVIKRQQNVGDDEIAYEETETGLPKETIYQGERRLPRKNASLSE